jgi:Tfp pilus tip-associated adhesin PilY1
MLTVDPQRFVCVIDRHDGRTLSDRDLTNQTSTIEDMNGRPGWYVDLWNGPGERVTEQAVVVAGTVIFTSFAPSLNACVAGGESWLYQMAYDTGGPAPNSEDEAPEDRSIDLGEGIASYPVVDLESGSIVVQSSDASIHVEPLAALYERMRVRAWHESFQAVQ